MFCHVLDELSRRDGLLEAEEGWRWLHQKLAALNQWGKLNCLLADGQRLYCYHDAAGYKGLHLRKVYIREQEVRHLEDNAMHVDLAGHPLNHGFVMATRPLSKTGWHTCRPGELIVLEGGIVRFSSHREARRSRVFS